MSAPVYYDVTEHWIDRQPEELGTHAFFTTTGLAIRADDMIWIGARREVSGYVRVKLIRGGVLHVMAEPVPVGSPRARGAPARRPAT